MDIKVSLFASAIRIPFYPTFLKSLKGTSIPYEVVFAGHNTPEEIAPIKAEYPEFKYIHTANIKPAQCYEVARRHCVGETIQWTADDCEYSPDLMGKAYNYWKSFNDEKIILSLQTKENGQFCDMRVHSFFGCQFHTPLMAPLALMSNKLMANLGGFDRRYICGQYENDAVMRVVAIGGRVEIFGDKDNMINIDHYARHGIHRPFALGYNHDRYILESSWTNGQGSMMDQRADVFEPYIDDDILTKSQSFNNKLWI